MVVTRKNQRSQRFKKKKNRIVSLLIKLCLDRVGNGHKSDSFLIPFVYQVIEARQKDSPYLLPEDVFVEKPRSAAFTMESIWHLF